MLAVKNSSTRGKRKYELPTSAAASKLHSGPRFQFPEDAVRGAPHVGFHEALDGAFEAPLAGDLGLLRIGVIALHGGEMLPEELVMIEVALDEFAHVLARQRLRLVEARRAEAEIGDHHRRGIE